MILSPQMTLASGVFCALLAGMLKNIPVSSLRIVAAAALVLALSSLARLIPGSLGPLVRLDELGFAWQFLFYAGALPAALLLAMKDEIPAALLLGSVLGMALLAVSDNLLMLFIGLEFMSLPAYLLIAGGESPVGAKRLEAAIKYFFAGGVAGAFFLMGMLLHYSNRGDLSLSSGPAGEAALILMGAAALFKVGAVPLHFWLPDAYEASAPELAGFFSTVLKAAGILFLMRIAALAPQSLFAAMLPALGAATMLFGSLLALRQERLGRLLAYSSIAHAGALVLGVGAWAAQGAAPAAAAPIFFYLAAYVLMSNGAFIFLKASGLSSRRELLGYAKAHPLPAGLFAVLLLALAGIPPTGGFVAKLLIFWEAVKCGLYGPLAVAGLASLIALSYYLGLIRAMYFEEKALPPSNGIKPLPVGEGFEKSPPLRGGNFSVGGDSPLLENTAAYWVVGFCALGALSLGLCPWFVARVYGVLGL